MFKSIGESICEIVEIKNDSQTHPELKLANLKEIDKFT